MQSTHSRASRGDFIINMKVAKIATTFFVFEGLKYWFA